MADMQEARREKQTAEHAVIDEAISDRGDGYTVFSIPVGVLYRPSASKVKNMASKNYLGQAKLVAATDATETFVGFTGAARAAAKNASGLTTSAGPSADSALTAPGIQRRGTTAARMEGTSTSAPALLANDLRRRPSDNTAAVTPSRLMRSATAGPPGRTRLAPMSEEPSRSTPRGYPERNATNRPTESQSYGDLLDSYDYADVPSERNPSDRITEWARNNTAPPRKASLSAASFHGGSVRRAPTRSGSLFDDGGYGSGADYLDSASSSGGPMSKIRVKLHHASDTRGMVRVNKLLATLWPHQLIF